jgi:glycosyltransferase involved in cell wall biosynthesis
VTVTEGSSAPSLALVNGSSRFSGITLSAMPYATALSHRGLRVRWYQCVDAAKEPYVPADGVVVPGLGLPIESLEMGINRLWVFPRRLRTVPEDVLLLTDPTLSFAAHGHPRTAVLVHDLLPLTEFADRRDSRWMFRAILPRLRRMRLIVVTTPTMGDELVRRGVDPGIVRVVPYTHELGVHPDHPARSVERIARTGVVRLLYIATDRPFKNVDFVLRLAERLNAATSGPRFEVTLLSSLRPETRRRVADMKLPNLRVVDRVASVGELYEGSDVLLYPSRHEGFGRPLIEAMAYGLPIFANRIQPFIDILGPTGTLLSVDSTEAWAAALNALVDGATYSDLARRSLERASAFSPDRFERSVAEAFRELLE